MSDYEFEFHTDWFGNSYMRVTDYWSWPWPWLETNKERTGE